MKTNIKVKFLRVAKIIFVCMWIIWTPLQLSTGPFESDAVKVFYSEVTGISASEIDVRPGIREPNPTEFDKLTRSVLIYKIIIALSFLIMVFGLLFLARGRNLFEKFILLQIFAIPLEKETWGKIYDLSNNKSVPFAVIRLIKIVEGGHEHQITQTVGDSDGRYRLYSILEKSEYIIEVRAEGYETYRKKLKHSINPNLALISDIPLEPLNYKHGLNIHQSYNKVQNAISTFLLAFIYIVPLLPFAFTIYNIFFHFGYAAVINAFLYGWSVPWNTYVLSRRLVFRPGKIIDSFTLEPVKGVTIEVFKDGRQILSTITDKSGVPKFDLEKGKYNFKVSKKGYSVQESFEEDQQEIIINKEGFIEQNISLVPINSEIKLQSELLTNPFS